MADEIQASLTLVACSGAKTKNVLSGGQYPRSDENVLGARPRMDVLEDRQDADIVLLSIGGNDAGFGEIGRRCAIPDLPTLRDCRDPAAYWVGRLDTEVFPRLVRTYRRVRVAAPHATVFALTFPNPIGPDSCSDIGLSAPELSFISDVFTPRLDEIIRVAAAAAGIRIIELEHALNGYRLCVRPLAESAVNFIAGGRTRGTSIDLSIRGLEGLAHGTFHPNEYGHQLMASAVQDAVSAARAGRLPPRGPPPPPGITPPPYVPDEVGPPTGWYPFPAGTASPGDEILKVSALSVEVGVDSMSFSGLSPSSTVCFREYRARYGIGSINEVLAQSNDGTWHKVVVSRLGQADEDAPPAKPWSFFLIAGAAALLALAALVWHWRARR